MNRRDALKTMAAAGIAVPVGVRTPQAAQAENRPLPDTLRGYTFIRQVELGDGKWSVYGKQELAMPIVLHEETFKPCRPFKPIFVTKRFGVREDGRIKEFPDVIVKNQHALCYNTEDMSERCLIVT